MTTPFASASSLPPIQPTRLPADPSVAVIGASSAGLFAAALLARQGLSVRIFEQSTALEPADRTLIVTNHMKDLLGPAAAGCILNEIRKFELFTDGRAATFTLNQPDLIIERSKLIRGLAAEAQSAGASLRLGLQFRGLSATSGGIALRMHSRSNSGESEEVRAQTVVAGDGATSRVARAAGWPALRTAPLVQAIVPLPSDMSPDTVRVWFVPADTPYFYWLIPESPDRGVLGLIGEAGAAARQSLEAFLVKRKLEPIEFQAARIPVYTRWVPARKRLGSGQVFVVGDAAAQVKVSTVGGIVTGLRGALGVAEEIQGGSSRELRQLRRELDLHLLVRRAMHHFQQDDYSRLVDSLNAPARRSLSRYSRDHALKVLWSVCLSQPRLILMGLRGLLTHGRTFGQSRD